MLVRGTRRLASGLALALVLLTLYMVYYGPNIDVSTRPKRLPQEGHVAPGTPAGEKAKLPPVEPMGPPKEDLPPVPPTPPGSGLTPDLPAVAPPPENQKPTLPQQPGVIVDPPARNPAGAPPIDVPGNTFNTDPSKEKGLVLSSTSSEAAKPTDFVRTKKQAKVGVPTEYVKDTHRELSSLTTSDGTYFDVDFSPWPAYNPNFTPHPTKNDTWITVAQYHKTAKDNQVWFTQIICEAKFKGNSLKCEHPPWTVPIPPTWSDKCTGDIAHFNFNIGPHDARVFYGPELPYILYGTQASYSCFGMYFQDFTLVSDWPGAHAGKFKAPTEIRKPPPEKYSVVEKNWFLFWDDKGEIYVHHDIAPKRIFGKMADDGTIAKDANNDIAVSEEQCLAKLMPYAKPIYAESVHQGTNSLSITMCKRADPTCVKTAENTFIFHIFHWKSFYEFHGLYEPYVHVFHQTAPFNTYGISAKPFWYRGRRLPKEWRIEGEHGWNQTEMTYTTSIQWKDHGMKYHGYLDDTLLLGFGIEDAECGGLDIIAADLFKDLNVCDGYTPPKIT